MIELSAVPVSASARPAPSTPARSADTQNDARQNQEADGLFQQELTRETNSLQNQAPAAKGADARDGATPADQGHGKDGRDQGPDPASIDSATLAALPGGIIPLPATAVDARSLPAAGEAALAGLLESATAAASAAPPKAALGLVPVQLPQTAVGPAAMSASPVLANTGNSRGTHARSAVPTSAESSRTDQPSAPVDWKQDGPAPSPEKTWAESAAAGKFLPAGRAALDVEPAAAPRIARDHPAEVTLPAGINIGAAAPNQSAHAATAAIAAHLAAPGWDRGLGEKMVWMASQQLQVAELHLNPPELGPLQVTLTISNDQASAQFVSQHASVRDAIESAMPRLREMLAEGGITLGNTSVGAESFPGQAQQDGRAHMPRDAARAELDGVFRLTQVPRALRGLVDIFA